MQPSTALQRTVASARQLSVLAVVPFVVAVLRWNDLTATAADTSTQFSITFPIPHSFITLWSFVNAPTDTNAGGAGDLPLVVDVGLGILFVVALAAFVVLSGLLLAGYLGSIAEGVASDAFDFAANIRRYARPMVAYEALWMLTLLGLVGGTLWLPVLLPVIVVGLFVVAYLTYLTPYLIVVENRGLVEAVQRSAELTTQRSAAVVAFVGFVALGAVLSVPVSMLAYGNGIAVTVFAAALTAPVGFLASVFFVELTRTIDADSSGSGPA